MIPCMTVFVATCCPLAVELDFKTFPDRLQFKSHSWIRIEVPGIIFDDGTPDDPIISYAGARRESLVEAFCLSFESEGCTLRRDGLKVTMTHLLGRPITKFQYRATGPTPAIRWLLRPEVIQKKKPGRSTRAS